jgi:hypothetical protein
MLKSYRHLLAAASLLLLAGCGSSPEEYRLTSQRLAWQGYQAGQVLRFAQRPAGPVRTYRIASVDDRLEKQQQGINYTLIPRRGIVCQQVSVTAQRTDTIAPAKQVLDFALNYYAGDIAFRATAGWDGFEAYDSLPIDSVNKGVAFDSLRYPGIRLVQSITFGGITYGPVLRILPFPPSGTPVKGALRVLFYAKGAGVVAFEETGRGLWYRLP